MFTERWNAMVNRSGIPLSTPNEVAITEVARTMRQAGCIVALSGEGADELFGGYDQSLTKALAFERDYRERFGSDTDEWAQASARHFLATNSFVSPAILSQVLRPSAIALGMGDHAENVYAHEFAEAAAMCPDSDPLQRHLRVHRKINLEGLLRRLDSATMLQSVEGRTPFADVVVASFAESLAMGLKFDATGDRFQTKIALRRAFADVIPDAILARPKASFPLPFQDWVGDQAPLMKESRFLREQFELSAITRVCANPREYWHLAWPMANLAIWGRRFG
jgi:asparagine synthase (glutamine-hydrolysing)